MANIDAKYEGWKNKLLDLGKRNRLINYRDTARSSIKIKNPECCVLWNIFVKEEAPLIFPFDAIDGENSDFGCEANVETNKTTSDLQKALRNLRNKAKTAIEEQGVNVLYLSFGFLNWTEAENSSQSFSSPLILVPAALTVESINSPYILTLHEDEIVLNPTLVYKLENDFGISLPSFDESADIDDFLKEIESKITLKNWSVTRDVSLSLLSFLKINMYSDLDKHKDVIVRNPIVRSISGEQTAVNKVPEEIRNYDFDKKEKSIDTFQVVDADSSQQEAILMAKKGVSFVLQGPPGTGKSQTITNIIAESLAEGKKVLFVSEKMAALDVVYKRLASAGLEDFCLVLHSHKANKKNVLEQLSKVLSLSQKKVTLSDEIYQKFDTLQADKKALNDYANQVYDIIDPLGKSIYEANGIVANLDSFEDFIFAIDDIRNITKEQYNKFLYLLSRFADTIGKMSNDYKSNPWKDSHIVAVTNEFRHDLAYKMNRLIPKIEQLDNSYSKILLELNLDAPHTFNGLKVIIDLLNCVGATHTIPFEWVTLNETQKLYEEIDFCANSKLKIVELTTELKKEFSFILSNDDSISVSSVDNFKSRILFEGEKEKLISYITNREPYLYWSSDKIDVVTEYIGIAKDVSKRIKTLEAELLDIYEPSVFELDYRGILARIKTEYNSIFKFFKKSYRNDKKTIMLHHKGFAKKVSDEEMIFLVETLKKINEEKQWYQENAGILGRLFGREKISEETEYRAFEKQIKIFVAINNAIATIEKIVHIFDELECKEALLQTNFKFLYNGIFSDWDLIRKSLDWAILFKNIVAKVNASERFIKSVCENGEFIQQCIQSKAKLKDLEQDISFDYEWFISNFDRAEAFNAINFKNLVERFSSCANGLSLLEEWIDYNSARTKCVEYGLGDFIRAVEEHNISVQNICAIFKKRFFRLWLDAVLPEYPAVLNFRRRAQEKLINEFDGLDKMQFEIAKARIKGKLINSLPSLEHFTDGVDEISILKRECKKQRKIMPIRRLFKAIPNLLLTLKPCLMMSPLSVSLFLETESYKFDIVIFDEASQVCTENAIGAISRAKQVVIAGDSKQLPPTNFFQTAVSEGDFDIDADEEDEYDDSNAYESILDEANMLPELTLRWHYRSRHESLIAFSNAKIYKNSLITYPSNIEKAANNGVEYIYVPNGFYDRGGKKGNVIEANKIADLVFKHFKEQPNRSLGVIAFGEVQQQAIETVIRERRLKRPEYEPFFIEDKEEAFFVKNLENVQGDERDTIIFSIGYAKDNVGVFRMNFGPLSKAGGERRLNVAITRAKFNVKLVGSILPPDIDIEKISSEGPKLLRAYIDFAINGTDVLDREITETDIVEHDSPFEEAVYNFLDRKGYRLATQVGCSGYRIDMAVKHPSISGIYVLGIECDGAAYHSARTARERDRLRQDVLEHMGWKLYRIWSTDWIKDPRSEEAKLLEAVENAIANFNINDEIYCSKASGEDYNDNICNFINVEERVPLSQLSNNPYGFEETVAPDFSKLPHNQEGYLKLEDCIMEIVNKEYPIHFELMCQRLAPLMGNEKATVKIRNWVDMGLSKLNDKITRNGDFIYPIGYQSIPVRMPNYRKIQHISIDELAEAMYKILQTCIGTNREALSSETARVYGFNRTGQNISLAMANAINLLIESGRIEEIGGKLRIKK